MRDIQTKSKIVSSKASTINMGGQVPTGMKRWITFLCFDAYSLAGAKPIKLYLASVGISNPTRASVIATGNRKWMIDLRATGVKAGTAHVVNTRGPPFMIPMRINQENPLFSIASGKWLGVYVSNLTANVFVQFFDE
jgi:hypothetical protein